ncbi:MAG: toprim domain-containing protein, partial [Polyangiaceae bacterium]
EIERLKREISIERLAEARGIALKKHGADLHGLCPFHEDREPSLVISPEKNLWHCLGACQTGGSVIDWVMRAEGVSFRHAVEWLRGGAPAVLPANPPSDTKRSTMKKLPTLLARDADNDALLVRVVDYYHRSLKESPEALSYLQSRGLVNSAMIDHFRLGFANRTLGYRLPEKNRKEGQEVRGRLQTLGILRESGHEHMNGSIVIPVFDAAGRVTEMYGRKITPGLRPGTPLHMYLPGPHLGVWNVQALEASREIILCESLIDALTFWSAGIRNVTASYGVEGFTNDHWTALKRYGVRCVRIAYDRDEAGDRAAERLSEELNAEGIETHRVQFPKGMDANEYALKMQPANRALELVVRQAVWMGKSRIEPKTGKTEATKENMESEVVAPFVPLAASSLPPVFEPSSSPPSPTPVGDELVMQLGDRRWRIRGVSKNLSHEQMKVNVLVGREEAGFFVDTMELYSARQRASFVKSASDEVGVEERVLKKDLGEVLLRLEALQEEQIRAVLKPKDDAVKVSDADREAALELLRDPRLLDRILADFERCGVVGEETNKLVGYLAAVSRKLEQPLGVVIQSSSAAGKSSLMEAILSLMPEEERVQYSAMTGQSLFYMGEEDLKHKILAVVEEEGASRASYALKLLQSEGELTIASTGKDPTTGK